MGAGTIARAHAPAWRALGAELVVHSADGAGELAAAYGGRVAASLGELLEVVDVVDVVTPTPTHLEIASAALAAGRHVLCEKPLGRTAADAAALLAAARTADRQLYPGHVVRFFPEYALLRQAVRAGEIGRPAVLRFARGGAFPAWAPWFADDARSGGVVLDLMVHDIDVARWVAGEVTSVYATRRSLEEAGAPHTLAHVVLTHAGGAITHVRGLWGAPHTSFRTSFHVAGDAGVLRFDSAASGGVRTDLPPVPSGGLARPAPAAGESPYLTEIREFAQAFAASPTTLRSDDPRHPRVSAVDGLVAVELAEAALASIGSGEPVTVDTAARVSDLGDTPLPPPATSALAATGSPA
ncbi:Gfo/Idh/MocA family oxidoreductase [Isoptericola sp. 4D.3]|uniref:Gfo/Idh/MocA family oxidoreductase n=1 Tax=Isoptericola peretonis TaxID=2918523 RepID=A0ABT0J443_9MICO|nr:Gfo/Idh/MocA family oxidoreductase [Isoptericola sp. 4D.3]